MKFEIRRGKQTPKADPGNEVISPEYRKEIEEFMKFTNNTSRCLGLSANQCDLNGKHFNKNFFVIKGFPDPLINPKILHHYGYAVKMIETCLSFPGKHIEVERYLKIRIEFMNLDGEKRQLDVAGLFAQICQHEYDHLNGIPEKFTLKTREKELPRNIPCPCGSGEKYKKCCMTKF